MDTPKDITMRKPLLLLFAVLALALLSGQALAAPKGLVAGHPGPLLTQSGRSIAL
jgi:hypothetical protein